MGAKVTLLAGAILCASSCSSATAVPSGPVALRISADRGWQDTGITLPAGRSFVLKDVAGRIKDQHTEIDGGNGSDYVCGSHGCCEPLPNERRSALVARVGTETFLVGDGTKHTTRGAGALQLRLNDCDEGLSDNSGVLTLAFELN